MVLHKESTCDFQVKSLSIYKPKTLIQETLGILKPYRPREKSLTLRFLLFFD